MSPTALFPRRPRAAFTAALLLVLGSAGCYGAVKDATHEGVSGRVSDLLVERDGIDRDVADAVGKCVADEMFAGDAWSKDERNDANHSLTADPPSDEVVGKLHDLLSKYGALPGETPVTDCSQAADQGSTTTTEGPTAGPTTTTTAARGTTTSTTARAGTTTTTSG